MSTLSKNKTRFRNNLKQFIELKEAGKLNGAAAQIKEKLKAAAGSVDLDFLKEYKTIYKNITRKNPCGCEHRENPSSFVHGLEMGPPQGVDPIRENRGVKPKEIYDMITENIISVIEQDGELPWQYRYSKGYDHRAATNFVSKNSYNGINFWMLNFFKWIEEDDTKKLVRHKWENPYFLTFNQVNDLGGKVKEGTVSQRAFFFSLLYDFKQMDPDMEFSTFDRQEMIDWLKDNSSQIKLMKDTGGQYGGAFSAEDIADQNVVPIVRYYNLFNGDDVEGIDFGGDWDFEKLSEADKIKAAESVFENYPNRPELKHEKQKPFYNLKKDFINMPKFGSYDEPQYYYSTLFHECVHSTGHKSRLDREFGKEFGDDKYAFEELVAEMGAAYLAAETGILFKTRHQSAAYLKDWNEKLIEAMEEHNTFFFRAASRSQAAADFILDRNADGVPAYRADGIRTNPETAKVCIDDIDCEVTVQAKTNAVKGGIEIRFSDAPPEAIRDELKAADFTFYSPNGAPPFWAAEITKERKELAEKIAGKFDSAVLKGSVKNLKDTRKKKTYKNFDENDLVKFVGLPKEVNGKKNPLVGKGGVVVNSQPSDVDVKIKGYGTLGFKPENLEKALQLSEAQQVVDKNKLPADLQPLGSTIEDSLTGDLKYELGADTTVDFKADGSVQKIGDYAIIEVQALQASHNKDCSVNSKHEISRSQPRDRSKEALCAQPSFIAKNLNPASITQGNLAFVGSPVVNAKGHAIQGNGRSIALKIAYDEVPGSAKKYRDYLIKNADTFGLDKRQIENFDQPVLVRMLPVEDDEAIELGNVVDTSQAKMSKIDQAKAYIRNLSETQLKVIGKLIQDSSGETIGAIIDDVGMKIIGQMKKLDRTGIVEKNKLTSEGKDFLRSVLVGLVFDGEAHPNALHHYMNLPHTIKAGIERSFGYIIPLIDNKGDVRDTLSRAVEVAAQTYQSDAINTAKEYAGSQDMFEAKDFSKREVALAQFFLDATTQKEIRDAFGYYVELLEGQENLFGKVPPKSQNQAFKIVFIDQARPNPETFKDEIIHKTIVRAQRLQTLGNDNSKELEKLNYLIGSDGWKWNEKGTQIIRVDNEDDRFERLKVLKHFQLDAGNKRSLESFKKWLKENYPAKTDKAELIWNSNPYGAWRKNPEDLSADVKRSVLDDFYAWIEGNPLMDYKPGKKTFENWIPYHYPGYADQFESIWATARPAVRANPQARFVYIGICDKMLIDNGHPEPITLQGPHGLLTNKAMNKLFIVPFTEMKGIDDEVADMEAEEVFKQWHRYAADDTNYEVNWPDNKEPQSVGTAHSIYYVSDKIMREWDRKGDLNVYHHEFDKGKRPCVTKGKILIVSNLEINENGILN